MFHSSPRPTPAPWWDTYEPPPDKGGEPMQPIKVVDVGPIHKPQEPAKPDSQWDKGRNIKWTRINGTDKKIITGNEFATYFFKMLESVAARIGN